MSEQGVGQRLDRCVVIYETGLVVRLYFAYRFLRSTSRVLSTLSAISVLCKCSRVCESFVKSCKCQLHLVKLHKIK